VWLKLLCAHSKLLEESLGATLIRFSTNFAEMARAMRVVVALVLAAAVVSQANDCSIGGECPSDDKPHSVVTLLQTKLQHSAIVVPVITEESQQAAMAATMKVNKVAAEAAATIANEEEADGAATHTLCSYLHKSFEQKLQGNKATVNQWLQQCDLPQLLEVANEGSKADHMLEIARSVADVDALWAKLPAGGIVDVAVNKESEGDENLLWQALYQVNSRLAYFKGSTGMTSHDLGLEDLEYVAFLPGHVVLQKFNSAADAKESDGAFIKLATTAGTDKIDGAHNYTLLYHRHLDSFSKTQQGMLLEIGLGCTMDYGAGASAKIWPELIPRLDTHFIELNAECTKRWLPDMVKENVKKVHVGSQTDPAVLAEITQDKQAMNGGLQVVIDDGSHETHHIEGSFRYLFPQVAPRGLYFVEDMMYSTWGTRNARKQQRTINNKFQRTSGTPIALAAVLASAATGSARAVPYPPDTWADNVLASYGQLVDFIECTPGICVYRRK